MGDTLTSLLEALRFDPIFMDNVTAWERIPARPARYADFPLALDPRLVELVRHLGWSPLYTHQAAALESALDHQNVVLVTVCLQSAGQSRKGFCVFQSQ